MKGDFSRDTFLEAHRFTRVLMQQGRVQLDADWNEQATILLHALRSMTADLVGPFGGPADNRLGFEVTLAGKGDFTLSPGHYYVDGILCVNRAEDYVENEKGLFYTHQKEMPGATALKPPDSGTRLNELVYLDVWERHVTYLQEDSIREMALNGADTASRAQLVTQVKVAHGITKDGDIPLDLPAGFASWKDWLFTKPDANTSSPWEQFIAGLHLAKRGMFKARGRQSSHSSPDICLASPDGRYRGAENQLYRVEIHREGKAWVEKDGEATQKDAATFKWSRENGCVVFAIAQLENNITLIDRPRDDRMGLHVNEWVEIVTDDTELLGQPGPMAEIMSVTPTDDPTCLQIRLRPVDGETLPTILITPGSRDVHPLLRRWDSRPSTKDTDPKEKADLLKNTGGALLVEEGKWINAEDGIQFWFEPAPASETHVYRTGDYWLVPARTAIEDVVWAGDKSLPPHGVAHHYAPLAIVPLPMATGSKAESLQDTFKSLVELSK
jgi:hypothetical protein